jgi:flagellar biosynthesis protein FlhG
MDQAETLRKLAEQRKHSSVAVSAASPHQQIKGIAVASGKGGVGKTNLVANLAYRLCRQGKKVLILDADMGLGNIHILLGLAPKFTLQHVLEGIRPLKDIIVKGPGGIEVLPAGSGNMRFSELNIAEKVALKTELEAIQSDYDYILFDLSAGLTSNVTYFCSVVQGAIVVASPEPTSFADAYAVMKVLNREFDRKEFHLVVNSVKNRQEGLSVYQRLLKVADRFGLNIRIHFVGHIQTDENVGKAVRSQSLFAEKFPDSPASLCIEDIAHHILATRFEGPLEWDSIFQ